MIIALVIHWLLDPSDSAFSITSDCRRPVWI